MSAKSILRDTKEKSVSLFLSISHQSNRRLTLVGYDHTFMSVLLIYVYVHAFI